MRGGLSAQIKGIMKESICLKKAAVRNIEPFWNMWRNLGSTTIYGWDSNLTEYCQKGEGSVWQKWWWMAPFKGREVGSHSQWSRFEHSMKKPVVFEESQHSTVCRCSAEDKGAVKTMICSMLSVLSSQSSLIFSASLQNPQRLKKAWGQEVLQLAVTQTLAATVDQQLKFYRVRAADNTQKRSHLLIKN